MSKSWGGSTGPWANWSKLGSIWDIGGWPIAARLILGEQEGVMVNVASPLFGSLVVGVYPDHRKHGCVTEYIAEKFRVEEEHYCWAAQQPHVELGPDPHRLQDVGRERQYRLQQLRERIELRLLGAAA